MNDTLPTVDNATAATPVVPTVLFLPSLTRFANAGVARLPVRVTCFEVLKGAGIEPWGYFSKFVDSTFSFLGRRLDGKVHLEMAQHLRQAEADFVRKAGGTPPAAPPAPGGGSGGGGSGGGAGTGDDSSATPDEGSDPDPDDDPPGERAEPPPTPPAKASVFDVGTGLGLAGPPDFPNGIAIPGSREVPTSASVSMHFFGMAIDVDFDFNFYPTTDGKTAINTALEDARLLLRPSEVPTADPTLPFGWPKASGRFVNLKHADIQLINEQLVAYFSMIDDTAQLQARLANTSHSPWAGMTAEAAKQKINTDLTTVHTAMERNKAGSLDRLRQTGIMQMPKAIVDGIGLSWGGIYGDTMHYDMRNRGAGASIFAAIRAFKVDATLQNELRETWKGFEGNSEADMLPEFVTQYPKP